MNPTSSIVTGGVTVTAATLVPLVQWALAGLPKPIPADVPYLIAAGLVTGAHCIYNFAKARAAAKTVLPPKATAQ